MTRLRFCDFVVWTNKELHIERIMLDETLIKSALPIAEEFYELCILPELLGKWYTLEQPPRDPTLQTEEDDGLWCHCKEHKGGDMVCCDNKSCTTTWFHLECVGLHVCCASWQMVLHKMPYEQGQYKKKEKDYIN